MKQVGFLLKLCTWVFRVTQRHLAMNNLANLQIVPKLPQPLLLLDLWPICPPWWVELESTSAYCRLVFGEYEPHLTSQDKSCFDPSKTNIWHQAQNAKRHPWNHAWHLLFWHGTNIRSYISVLTPEPGASSPKIPWEDSTKLKSIDN